MKNDCMVTIIINSPEGQQIHTYYMDFMAAHFIDMACCNPENFWLAPPDDDDRVNVSELERKLYPKVK